VRLTVKNTQGEEVDTIEVDDRVFGITPNRAVVHQALLAHLANRRAGTASTKTRGEVRGSTAKIRRQKGSGRARMGSIRAPNLTGGGVAFGPRPRSFVQGLPKRMRRLAIRSILSDKAAEGRLQVLDRLALDKPRTKDVAEVLANLEVSGSALIVIAEPERNVLLGARNLPETKVLAAAYLNVVDMLSHRALILTVDAVRRAEALWGGERALRRRGPPAGEQARLPDGQVSVGEGS
jgi:large subunit ribosomal protein L4